MINDLLVDPGGSAGGAHGGEDAGSSADPSAVAPGDVQTQRGGFEVYGDSAYADGQTLPEQAGQAAAARPRLAVGVPDPSATMERKISHFTSRSRGGRKAHCRGQARIVTDVQTGAGSINLAGLASLGLVTQPTGGVLA